MRQNGSVPTNKRNGLAISRIDEEYCFIRVDKTERERPRESQCVQERGERSERDGGRREREGEREKERKKETCLIKSELEDDV